MFHPKNFVLIHGAWHDHHAWDFVVPFLEDAGYLATALDLPGAGATAKYPSSYLRRPFDLEAFTAEHSPNANVTQEERTDAVITAVRELNARSSSKAVLVGHSLGGLTVSHVAEAISDELSAVVYCSALMLPSNMLHTQMNAHETMSGRLTPNLEIGDPVKTGVMRFNPKSDDPNYRALVKAAFYADVTEERFQLALSYLIPDEPAQVTTIPSPITKKNFGRISRYYIQCTQDNAIPLAAQQEMVSLVDADMNNATTVHSLESSHSPFFSHPEEFAQILKEIAES
ncbi:alpha/beta fold hydrolase [Halodesulfovibrio sp. MK-HDV]|jgi:pimeloyl-ACP methyl ester carboxylesterase|uniref:alpha/beta fold hydrolase n=1 Tax=Halodesulfovibrio sp. MK-HDV TaxID=2599925 RepID=UPI00136CBE4E|nr:alpha/beta fold hydrolase [Halodesulfovibrio sp. MK-HDV]KAF1073488.1 Pyrethroid hydrolase [Halodesulfovibrio sp. MK-HDV]